MEECTYPTNAKQMTRKWLEEVLTDTYGNFNIKSCTIDTSLNGGHGVVSSTFAVNIIGSNHHDKDDIVLRLVVKIPSNHPVLRQLSEMYEYDYRETMMYMTFLLDLKTFSKECGAGELTFVAPKCYYGRTDPLDSLRTVLILENLKYSGYKMADYESGLDFRHLIVAIREVAKFHGNILAMKTAKKISNFKQLYPFLMDTEMRDTPNPYIIQGFCFVIEFLKEARVPTEIINKLPVPEKAERLIAQLILPEGPMTCVNHVDCTARNLMFQYNESEPVSCKMIDYQMCMYSARPTSDFWLLLLCSGDVKERRSKLELFKNEYLSTIEAVVRAHGLSTWSYDPHQFESDMHLGQLTGTLHCISGAQEWFTKSKEGKERLISLVMDAEEAGVLDTLQQINQQLKETK